MAQQSFPFENIDTTETQFSQMFRNLNAGVDGTPAGTELKVTAGTGLQVALAAGQAMVRGHYYLNTASLNLTIETADLSNPRIDSIVLTLDVNANSIVAAVVKGTPASSPVAPALTQTDAGVYQMLLANVAVPAASVVLGTITDKREFMGERIGLWTTDTRPTDPILGKTFGYNTTLSYHEFWNGSAWTRVAPEVDLSTLIPKSVLTTAGDLIVASGASTPARLGIGAADTVLGSNGTTASWIAAPAPTKTISLTGDMDTFLGNTAGYHNLSRKVTTGGSDTVADTGLLYIDNTLVSSTATVVAPQNTYVAANSRIEYYPKWATSTSGLPAINGLHYANGIYVAAHTKTSTFYGGISISTDASTWTNFQTTYGQPSQALAYAFGNGTFVAAYGTTTLSTSTNALTWTTRTTGFVTSAVNSIAFGNGLFVTCQNNSGILATSTDGITWTTRSVASWTGAGHYSNRPATYGASGWIMHSYGTNDWIYSTDGLSWTKGTTTIGSNNFTGSTFGNGTYATISYSGSTRYLLTATSISGPWTARTSGLTQSPTGIVFGAGVFVIGDQGGGIRTSTDAITWTARTSNITSGDAKVEFLNGSFFAVPSSSGFPLQVSTNAITWTTSPRAVYNLGAVSSGNGAYGNGIYLFDAYVRPAFSTNGVDFVRTGDYYYQSNETQSAVIYANGLYVVAGNNAGNQPGVQVSTNGIVWDGRTVTGYTTPNQNFKALAYGTGVGYVAAGVGGILANSTDGLTWTSRTSGFGTTTINALAYGAGKFIAAGVSGILTNSTNGISWNTLTSPAPTSEFSSAMFANGLFFMGTTGGGLFVSTDAITWTSRTTGHTSILSMDYDGGVYAISGAVSGAGMYVSISTDGISWRPRSGSVGGANPLTALAYGTKWVGGSTSGLTVTPLDTPPTANLFTTNFGQAVVLA